MDQPKVTWTIHQQHELWWNPLLQYASPYDWSRILYCFVASVLCTEHRISFTRCQKTSTRVVPPRAIFQLFISCCLRVNATGGCAASSSCPRWSGEDVARGVCLYRNSSRCLPLTNNRGGVALMSTSACVGGDVVKASSPASPSPPAPRRVAAARSGWEKRASSHQSAIDLSIRNGSYILLWQSLHKIQCKNPMSTIAPHGKTKKRKESEKRRKN